ncbi:MAG: hypothetical protein QXE21_04895 [Candidatus Korarchaeota archaeon]
MTLLKKLSEHYSSPGPKKMTAISNGIVISEQDGRLMLREIKTT